jgi:hypothetical protein
MYRPIIGLIFVGVIALLFLGVDMGIAKDKQSKSEKATEISQQEIQQADTQLNPTQPEQTASPTSLSAAQAGEEINWQVISGGGDIDGNSTNFRLSGTVAQTAVGGGGSTNYSLSHGFWQTFATEDDCDCMPGDANGDALFPPYTGGVNIGDAVYMISYIFKGGPAPIPYPVCSGDANGDCQPNVGDAVYIISYVFKGGPPPPTCEEWRASCGELH